MIAYEGDTLGATLRKKLKVILLFWFLLASIGCGTGSTNHGTSTDDITSNEAIVVNSLSDKVIDIPWLRRNSMTSFVNLGLRLDCAFKLRTIFWMLQPQVKN